MSAIAAGLGAVIDDILGGAQAGPNPLTWDDLAGPMNDIVTALTIIRDTMDSADRDMREAVTAATDAATQFEEIGNDVKEITEHTYTVVIPHSMSWLVGWLISHIIDPIRAQIADLERRVSFLEGWRNQIDSWRRNFVDPNLEKWIGWHQWFVTWPQSVLFTWHDWFEHPGKFANWATPPLIGPFVSYLADREHAESRDNLSLILTAAWQEVPNRTWELMLRYMVTEK